MDEDLRLFFQHSPIAEKVRLKGRIVVQRTSLTPGEVQALRERGAYGPIPKPDQVCELEVGGKTIARGKIVRRRGEYYFKVLEREGMERSKRDE